MSLVFIVIVIIAAVYIATKSKTFNNDFAKYYANVNQNVNNGGAFSPIMYNKTIDNLARDVIDEELKEHSFSASDSTPAVELKKTIIAVIYSIIMLSGALLYVFRVSQVISILFMIVATIVFLIAFFKVDVYGLIYKEFKARPDEDMGYIVSSFVQNKTSKIPFVLVRLLIIFGCILAPFIAFRNPKIFYEKVDGGYSIRFYAGYKFPEELVIPDTYNGEPIVGIRGNVFKNLRGVKKITLPANLKTINGHAFENSKDLKEVILPESLESIGAYAFNRCDLYDITLPAGITDIESYAFANNYHLYKVDVKGSINRVGAYAFVYDSKLEVVGNNTFKDIGAHAFEDTSLSSLVLEDGLEDIPVFAFKGTKISTLVLPSSVKKVGESAFEGSALKNLTLNDGLEYISESAFRSTKITSVVIPDTVTHVSAHAFRECSSLTSVILSKRMTEIKTSTFRETAIKSIDIPEGVVSIGENAFSHNPYLSSVTIPKSLLSIGEKAFRDCTSLKEITIPKGTTIGKKAFDGAPTVVKKI